MSGYLLKKGIVFLLFILLLLTAFPSQARNPKDTVRLPDSSTERKERILQGIGLIYDQRFEEAERLFRDLGRSSPGDPAVPFYLAMVTWCRLTTGSWGSDTVTEYKNRIDEAVAMAKSRISREGTSSEDLLYLGGALGFLARFELMQQNWFSSFILASDALDVLKECLRLDPQNKDVLLGLGIFDYYTARFSGVLKFLTVMFLHRGEKAEGIRKIREAADGGTYSVLEAKSMLAHIFLFLEDNPSEARPVCEELSARFPRSYPFLYFKGLSYVRLGLQGPYEETLRTFRERGKDMEEGPIWQRRALYLQASDALFQERYPQARALLEGILKTSDPVRDPGMVAWPLVKMGISYDLEGKREEARAFYQRVMDMENGAGAQFLARRHLRAPPSKKDPFIGY